MTYRKHLPVTPWLAFRELGRAFLQIPGCYKGLIRQLGLFQQKLLQFKNLSLQILDEQHCKDNKKVRLAKTSQSSLLNTQRHALVHVDIFVLYLDYGGERAPHLCVCVCDSGGSMTEWKDHLNVLFIVTWILTIYWTPLGSRYHIRYFSHLMQFSRQPCL